MKIIITEKQYDLLLGDIETSDIDEQSDNPSAAQPTTGTSSSGSKEGYPEVGKWESGVTRGPSNQVGVTKWSDVVGSTLTRGKANQLK
jgi:hypothetical protein